MVLRIDQGFVSGQVLPFPVAGRKTLEPTMFVLSLNLNSKMEEYINQAIFAIKINPLFIFVTKVEKRQ